MEQARRGKNVKKVNKKNKQPVSQNSDYILLAVVLVLLGFGLLMIYSASSYEASIEQNDASFYLIKQAKAIALGLVALIIFSRFPNYKKYQNISGIIWILSLVLILLVKTKLGITKNGATRWISIAGISFQPAEAVKLSIIILQANLVAKMGKSLQTFKGVCVYFTPPFISALLIYVITKNLSSAVIVFGIAVCILFVSVPNYKWFIGTFAVGAAAIAGIVYYIVNSDANWSFRSPRIKAWLNPTDYSTDKAYQTLQALYAIGSGGLFGKGLGQSMQKRRFLPEAQNDMIFSIVCEELGFFGAVMILLLFVVLIWSCMVIANSTKDRFGSLLVVGIMSHYAIQVILNVAVVTNLVPNTGVTFPFISYGGSAVCFLLVEIGIVLNVSQTSKAMVEYD